MVASGLLARRRRARPACVSRVSGPQPFASLPCRGAPSMVWPTHGTAPQFSYSGSTDFKTNQPRNRSAPARNIDDRITRLTLADSGLRWVNAGACMPGRVVSGRNSTWARSASACSTGRSRRHSSGRDKSRARPDRNIAARASGNNAPRAPSRSPPAGGSPAGSRSRASGG